MNVKLIAHTELSEEFRDSFDELADAGSVIANPFDQKEWPERAAVALTAIRTCYSANKPTEIISTEGDKYFGQEATDREGGAESDRLLRHITRSGHTSTVEHISYTFAIEGVSRALLAQLTRHRHLSFSVQSQRYVRMGSEDKTGGFDYVTPPSLKGEDKYSICNGGFSAEEVYNDLMEHIQWAYDALRLCGVKAEDARMVLPNAATTNLVLTGNLRALTDFYRKRQPGKGAQWEIADLAEMVRSEIIKVDPWTEGFF